MDSNKTSGKIPGAVSARHAAQDLGSPFVVEPEFTRTWPPTDDSIHISLYHSLLVLVSSSTPSTVIGVIGDSVFIAK